MDGREIFNFSTTRAEALWCSHIIFSQIGLRPMAFLVNTAKLLEMKNPFILAGKDHIIIFLKKIE